MFDQGRSDLLAEGISEDRMHFNPQLDMRYLGQSFELTIPFDENYLEDFHISHEQNYGISHPDREVEIVNIRMRASGLSYPPELPRIHTAAGNSSAALLGSRAVVIDESAEQVPLYRGDQLQPAAQMGGPALIVRNDTTVYLPQDSFAVVDEYLNLLISIEI